MGDYESESSSDYDQYEDEEQGVGNHYIQRKTKIPKDLAGAASGDGEPCCAHVVSPLVFFTVLAALAIVTYFLRQAITMNLGRRRRKRSSDVQHSPTKNLLYVVAGNDCLQRNFLD
jgi:hypothetical protein